MAVINHVGLKTDATGTEVSSTINARSISWISNNGANDITFNFDDHVTSTGAFLIPAGGIMSDININVDTIYYICTAGSTDFCLFGEAL